LTVESAPRALHGGALGPPSRHSDAEESGIDVEADAWMGLIAPAGTPAPVTAKIHREVVEAIMLPTIRDKLATQLMEPIGNTPAQFRARIEADIARWTPVIRATNIKVN
jgi:tripartite-type tricarboxylate transporter receptor subunit TctC